MYYVNIDMDPTSEVLIYPLADLHIGDAHCDMDNIQSMVDEIGKKDNARVILNGDLMNNATKDSVSDVYGDKLTPNEQVEMIIKLLEPVKDKIIAITSGNHEKRTARIAGIDLSSMIAARFDLLDRYDPDGVVVFLNIGKGRGKVSYSIYATHGSGGGRKEGGKINRLTDMQLVIDTDVYIHSHTHLPALLTTQYYRPYDGHKHKMKIECVDKLCVNTSSQLNYGGYGQANEYKPSSKDTPVISLSGVSHAMKATL